MLFLLLFQAQLYTSQFPQTSEPKLKGTKLHQVRGISLLPFVMMAHSNSCQISTIILALFLVDIKHVLISESNIT